MFWALNRIQREEALQNARLYCKRIDPNKELSVDQFEKLLLIENHQEAKRVISTSTRN